MPATKVLSLSDYRALAEFRYQLRRFLHLSEMAARQIGLEPQHHQLLLAVKDEGCGIIQENLDKIFDPFFTTKETGTGLGLSVVHQIVQQHGGLLTVANNQDRGVTFSILLPAGPGAAA